MKGVAAQGRSRTLWLGAALLATLLAAQWVSGEDGRADTVQPDEETGPRKETRAPETRAPETEMTNAAEQLELELELERLERRKFSAQAGDIFRQQSWAPPPPSPSSLKPPPPPPPPPLQFKYLGKVTAGDETQVFLALAERNYIVKPGDTVNSQYRMDEVNDHSITFTYLPLNATQTLATAQAGDIP